MGEGEGARSCSGCGGWGGCGGCGGCGGRARAGWAVRSILDRAARRQVPPALGEARCFRTGCMRADRTDDQRRQAAPREAAHSGAEAGQQAEAGERRAWRQACKGFRVSGAAGGHGHLEDNRPMTTWPSRLRRDRVSYSTVIFNHGGIHDSCSFRFSKLCRWQGLAGLLARSEHRAGLLAARAGRRPAGGQGQQGAARGAAVAGGAGGCRKRRLGAGAAGLARAGKQAGADGRLGEGGGGARVPAVARRPSSGTLCG